MHPQLENYLIKVAGSAAGDILIGPLYSKLTKGTGWSDRLAERLLDGGKHSYFKGWRRGAAVGGGLGATAGGIFGKKMADNAPAAIAHAVSSGALSAQDGKKLLERFTAGRLTASGAGVGGMAGAGLGAGIGMVADGFRNAAHRGRRERLAQTLRTGAGAAAVGAAGLGGLAAYRKSQK